MSRTRERDAETDVALAAAGWACPRFWEHEDPIEVAEAVRRQVLDRR